MRKKWLYCRYLNKWLWMEMSNPESIPNQLAFLSPRQASIMSAESLASAAVPLHTT
jgi:hypothetical protein